MEKRLLIAIALSVGLMLLWNTVLFPPPRPPVPAKPGVAAPRPGALAQTLPARPAAPGVTEETGQVPTPPGTEPPTAAAVPAERVEAAEPEEKTIETALYRIRIANRGAAILSWQLKKYTDDAGQPLDLISPGAAKVKRFPLGLELADSKLNEEISRSLFRMEIVPGPDGRGTRVSLRYADGAGLSVSKTLDFAADSYVSRAEIEALRSGTPLEGQVIWGAGFGPDPGLAKGDGNRNHITQGVIHRDGTTVHHPREALKGKPLLAEPGSVTWAGLEDHYFAGLLIPDAGTSGTVLRVHQLIEEGRERNFLSLGLALTGSQKYSLYVGPKDYDLLKSLNLGIEGIVNFGFFGAIAHALFFLLEHIHRYTGNWGWSIILLTVIIRLAFFPLTQKSSVSMRHTQEKMKKIQPKIQAIKERYRKMKRDIDGRQKMNKEIMDLYSKEGVNPLAGMSGCLPLLLQLPILWGFYNLLNSAIELRHAPFALWIQDLSAKDPYYVTPIVMGVTMLIQQAMTSSSIPDPTQRRMMMLMPLMFTWFFKDLPSGLVLYWLINNILAIGQQYLINSQVARETSADKAPARG